MTFDFAKRSGIPGEALAPSIEDYVHLTEVNVRDYGRAVNLRSRSNRDWFVHPSPMVPFGVSVEARQLLFRVYGFATDDLSRPFATTVNADTLAGLNVMRRPEGKVAIGFRYLKQFTGVEPYDRILEPEGFAVGRHPGHGGDPGRGIEPEKPSVYLYGEQLVVRDGELVSDGPRTFPLARILGLMGDPTNPAFRAEHGLY